jgi:hypothetical protein
MYTRHGIGKRFGTTVITILCWSFAMVDANPLVRPRKAWFAAHARLTNASSSSKAAKTGKGRKRRGGKQKGSAKADVKEEQAEVEFVRVLVSELAAGGGRMLRASRDLQLGRVAYALRIWAVLQPHIQVSSE